MILKAGLNSMSRLHNSAEFTLLPVTRRQSECGDYQKNCIRESLLVELSAQLARTRGVANKWTKVEHMHFYCPAGGTDWANCCRCYQTVASSACDGVRRNHQHSRKFPLPSLPPNMDEPVPVANPLSLPSFKPNVSAENRFPPRRQIQQCSVEHS